tara:strand:+ start:876 stop:1475 length:600 start_codon:yes stop_codon:yes gene_type:complete
MEYMKELDDNAFELAIVDPPYGIGESGGKNRRGKSKHEKKDWDNSTPSLQYFQELQRVSKNQVIWGANYFPEKLQSSMGWVCWDKKLDNSDFSDFELAYTSFRVAAKIFRFSKNGGSRSPHVLASIIHPCQKPVKLYQWLLANYAKEGDKILDTHLGSGSSAIAAHYGGFDFVGCELDEDYFYAAKARIHEETKQAAMF